VLLPSCGGGAADAPEVTSIERRVSAYEVMPPYAGDTEAFWNRADLYVMRPDLLPLDAWPDEVLFPNDHGVRVIVLLPGDYRARSDGSLPPGVLIIRGSGTQAEPILVTYASAEGADVFAEPHPAQRVGESEARLIAIRVFDEVHQYFHGLTFRDGVSAGNIFAASDIVIDRCVWHNTGAQPMRIRIDAHHNLVQRCVFQRFDSTTWGSGDTVAIQVSDGVCTHNRIVSNVILNFTDSYQHTDRDGDEYGLGAGTIIDNNFFGFTAEAYLAEPEGELMCGENSLDFKMGGTRAEPVLVTNNVFFGVRAAKAGCAASGSGGYAVTMHRRGTWIELNDNLFIDNDSGVFLNLFFLNVDQAQGRIDPNLTFARNVFSGIRSFATAFPSRTGRVLTGASGALFVDNRIVACERLMEREPAPGSGTLVLERNHIYGALELDPRDAARLVDDGNVIHVGEGGVPTELAIPWVDRTLEYLAPP